MSDDIQVLGPGVVLLRGRAALEAMHLVDVGVRAAELRSSPHLGGFRLIRRALHRANELSDMSAKRHGDTTFDAVQPDSELCEDGYRLSTADAAKILGVTARHTQRLAHELGGIVVGRRWVFDREAVLAHKALRDKRDEERRNG